MGCYYSLRPLARQRGSEAGLVVVKYLLLGVRHLRTHRNTHAGEGARLHRKGYCKGTTVAVRGLERRRQ